jgi:CheY-like chemotaxis protein
MKHRRILVAGTGTANLKIIREKIELSSDAYRVQFARSGGECVKKVSKDRYDLVLLEYKLGDRNGVDVIERLRERDINIPLVLLLEEGEKVRGQRALDKGATDYLVKDTEFFRRLPLILEELIYGRKMVLDIPTVKVIHRESEADEREIEFPVVTRQGEKARSDIGEKRMPVDQHALMQEISQTILACSGGPLNLLLERLAEVGCQVFRFKRSTIALLDERSGVFRRQVMIGYRGSPEGKSRPGEISRDTIERLFGARFHVKMVYRNQGDQDVADLLNARVSERRTQQRRPPDQWREGDVILVNLNNNMGATSGYISFDDPGDGMLLTREMFHNMELYGQAASFAIENQDRFSLLQKRTRRMEQLLVSTNIFKLNLKLNELFNEIVWSIKFSSDFNLVALGLISKKSGNLEIKAVACDDKIKQNRLLEMSFLPKQLIRVFRDEYRRAKSYLINRPESVFHSFKRVYYGSKLQSSGSRGSWPICGVLLVPIRSRQSKTIGILIADDPEDSRMPTDDDIHILEILTDQFAIAIDNRHLYVQVKQNSQNTGMSEPETEPDFHENPTLAIKRMADRIFNRK